MKNYLTVLFAIGALNLYAQHDTLSANAIYVDPSLFDDSELLVGWEEAYCAIAVSMDEQDTTFAPCYLVTYRDHYTTSIELCPDNLDEVGGLGLFNGDPRLLDRSLFEDMEADGSNIIGNDNFTVNYNNLTTGEKVGNGNYCIEAELYEGTTNTWYQTFQILKGPVNRPGGTKTYHTAETIGILKNGMVLEHTPPSSESNAAMMGGIIPIDYCGWHPEPAGFGSSMGGILFLNSEYWMRNHPLLFLRRGALSNVCKWFSNLKYAYHSEIHATIHYLDQSTSEIDHQS